MNCIYILLMEHFKLIGIKLLSTMSSRQATGCRAPFLDLGCPLTSVIFSTPINQFGEDVYKQLSVLTGPQNEKFSCADHHNQLGIDWTLK